LSYTSYVYHPIEVFEKAPEAKVEEPAPKSVEEVKAPADSEEHEKPASYEFKYEVHDEKTGDIKSQSETAVHGVVKGYYTLIDSDGHKRIVSRACNHSKDIFKVKYSS
jgi:Insect cuticle protein